MEITPELWTGAFGTLFGINMILAIYAGNRKKTSAMFVHAVATGVFMTIFAKRLMGVM